MGDPSSQPTRAPLAATAAPPPLDPFSAMTPRFNFFFRWFAKRFFGEITLDEATVARLRALEAAGSVVYVMRYASRLDYFLFNWLFLRHGLRLSTFANGIRFDYYQPFWQALLGRLLDEWSGDAGKVRRVAVSYRGMDMIAKDVKCRGVVTAKRSEGGRNVVELEVWTEDPSGNKTTPGTAVVELPSRN